MRARLLTLAAVVAAGLVAAAPAGAETRPRGGGAFVDDDGNPTAVAVDVEDSAGGGGGGGGLDSACHWNVVVEDDFAFNVYRPVGDPPVVQHSATGRWLERVCDGVGAVDVGGFFLVPEGGLVDPAALAQDALASIGIMSPAIRTSPSADDRLYVRVPTWLWLDSTWWRPYGATASAGRVTSSVTARPTRTAWTFGDGTAMQCSGPGRAWRVGLADDATDCIHTYTTSSAGQVDESFDLSATVQFEVTWSSNTGQGGMLPVITRASTVAAVVGEIQAVGTG